METNKKIDLNAATGISLELLNFIMKKLRIHRSEEDENVFIVENTIIHAKDVPYVVKAADFLEEAAKKGILGDASDDIEEFETYAEKKGD